MSYHYLEDEGSMRAYIDGFEFKKSDTIALDLEAELFRHHYGETLCLVQIYDGTQLTIIDPLKIDPGQLGALFQNRAILKIMYDAPNDISLVKNTLQVDIKSILDLRPAVELLDYEKKDLHSVIDVELGVKLEHKSRFQTHDWTRRPVFGPALDYALNDVRYLFRLKDAILPKLYQRDLMETYILKNLQVQNRDYRRDPADRYKKVKGYYALDAAAKVVFKQVFEVRDAHAQRLDMPPHNVIGQRDILEIAAGTLPVRDIRFPRRFDRVLKQRIMADLAAVVPPSEP